MLIRWKVVTEDRKSCLITGKYCLYYKKGSVVEARKETVGVMTFTTKVTAEKFILHALIPGQERYIVIKVKGLGKGRKPKEKDLCHYTDVKIFYEKLLVGLFYRKSRVKDNYSSSPGTMCYKKVKVLT